MTSFPLQEVFVWIYNNIKRQRETKMGDLTSLRQENNLLYRLGGNTIDYAVIISHIAGKVNYAKRGEPGSRGSRSIHSSSSQNDLVNVIWGDIAGVRLVNLLLTYICRILAISNQRHSPFIQRGIIRNLRIIRSSPSLGILFFLNSIIVSPSHLCIPGRMTYLQSTGFGIVLPTSL